MTDKGGKAKSGDGHDGDDNALWAAAMADVKPLKNPTRLKAPATKPAGPKKAFRPTPDAAPAPAKGKGGESAGTGLDRRSDERLRRGKMPVEATLDLHGFTQQEAYEALRGFLLGGYEAGRRCVLVVTGKGREGQGVLRARVPEWLADKDLRDLVLRYYPAQPQHGGAGALYILLRRKR